jgi:hypothetical protein
VQAIWPRADTVVWLDLPLHTVLARMVRRSWRRWRKRELLWGSNREPILKFLRFWDPNCSLFAFTVATYGERRRRYLQEMANPRWSNIRFIQLRSGAAVEEFARAVERAARHAQPARPNSEQQRLPTPSAG